MSLVICIIYFLIFVCVCVCVLYEFSLILMLNWTRVFCLIRFRCCHWYHSLENIRSTFVRCLRKKNGAFFTWHLSYGFYFNRILSYVHSHHHFVSFAFFIHRMRIQIGNKDKNQILPIIGFYLTFRKKKL